ncbi:retrovirus-related pol polyprotein from transposon TNT 1-94 [Tanacetum coccineum]
MFPVRHFDCFPLSKGDDAFWLGSKTVGMDESLWLFGLVGVRTYLLGGAIVGSEANGIIRDPKLELESSRFTFDLVPLSYESVDVVVGENWLLRHKAEMVCHEKVVKIPCVPKELIGFTPRRRIGFRMELVQGATSICEGSCRLTSLERKEVWNDCKSCKVRVGSNGNLWWEASVLLGRKKGCVMDTLKFPAMTFGLTNAPAVFMELMSRVIGSLTYGRSGAIEEAIYCGRIHMGNERILAVRKEQTISLYIMRAEAWIWKHALEKRERSMGMEKNVGLPLLWAVTGESELNGSNLVQETTNKIVVILERLEAAKLSSNASTKYKGKKVAKPIIPPSESASKEDIDPEQGQRDKDMHKNLALIVKYFKKIYNPTKNNLKTSSNSINKNVDTSPRYKNENQTGQFRNQRTVTVVGARETVGSQVVQQTGIQCFNCKEFGHFAKESEQADWLEDMDEKIDEQESEAHYSYMAKNQEVPIADLGTDTEPLEQVQYNAEYNVFANERQHFEQPESISNTCVVEKVDSNVIPDSQDMCNDNIQNDQNAKECDAERVALANLISNLKLNVDENKRIQNKLNKANTSLAHELKECKSILAKTSRTLGKSNSIPDSCLIVLQNKQTELETYKTLNDNTVDYDKLEHKELVNQAWEKHSHDHFRASTTHDMEILIKTCLMPLALKTQNDSFKFVHELKQEMQADLKYIESLEKEIDELAHDKAEFSNMYDLLLQECVPQDVMCSYLHSLSDLDAHAEFFAKLEKYSISLELALQQCPKQMKNDTVFKEKASNVFLKEREQYFKIQDLKTQLQDKNIAISELKKLIEKCKGKSVKTKINKSSIVRQPNAQRIPKPSVLGKPTPFSDSLERKSSSKTKSVPKNNVSQGIYRINTRPTQTRAPQLPQTSRNTDPRVFTSTRIIHRTNVSIPPLRSTQMKDKVVPNNSQVKLKKTEVEDHHRISSISNKTKSVTACNDSLKSRTLNVNVVCATWGKYVFNSNHDACVSKFIHDVNTRTKKPNVIVQLILFIVDSGSTKHMTGNLKLLCNFVKKYLGIVCFGNDQFALILGYGDLAQGNITINKVYYVESLNYNLLSVGQFCDANLEVVFQKSTRVSLEIFKETIYSPKDIMIGLPKLKYVKDQLCSFCEVSKATRSSFKTKIVPSSKGRLNLLHMDLCGPMRVASINGKKYILVIVDDYSRYTWTLFLCSKDETAEVLKDFLTMIQRNLQAPVISVRTDRGTEFLNKTLNAFFKEEGIEHQTSTPRTPEQNGIVERRNHTLVEAARTMLSASKLPLFFWAEAIATACYTQNRSIIIPTHEKMAYHIINDRKPSIKHLHIFGCTCYLTRDGENLDKMKEKGDSCILVGYSTQSKGYRVYNKRTRLIVESIHLKFDEIKEMSEMFVANDTSGLDEVYVGTTKLFVGFLIIPEKVYRLRKSLYGLKQAPRSYFGNGEGLPTWLLYNWDGLGSRVDEMILARERSGFAGEKVWGDIPVPYHLAKLLTSIRRRTKRTLRRILLTILPTEEIILDNESSDDGNNDDDVEKDEEDEEEEEHLAPANPSAVPTDDPVPSS